MEVLERRLSRSYRVTPRGGRHSGRRGRIPALELDHKVALYAWSRWPSCSGMAGPCPGISGPARPEYAAMLFDSRAAGCARRPGGNPKGGLSRECQVPLPIGFTVNASAPLVECRQLHVGVIADARSVSRSPPDPQERSLENSRIFGLERVPSLRPATRSTSCAGKANALPTSSGRCSPASNRVLKARGSSRGSSA